MAVAGSSMDALLTPEQNEAKHWAFRLMELGCLSHSVGERTATYASRWGAQLTLGVIHRPVGCFFVNFHDDAVLSGPDDVDAGEPLGLCDAAKPAHGSNSLLTVRRCAKWSLEPPSKSGLTHRRRGQPEKK
jgi:hypothetical protein